MNQPFIIGIGAQKAGTSWLSVYLDRHPEVCFSPRKELHYFDAKYVSHLSGNWNERFQKEYNSNSYKKRVKWIMKTGLFGKHAISYKEFISFRLDMIKDEQNYLRYFGKLNTGEKYNAEITPSYSILDLDGFKAIKRLLGRVKIIFIMRNPTDRFWSNMRHIRKKKSDFDPQAEFADRLSNDQNYLRTNYKRTIELLDEVFDPGDVLYLFYEHLFHGEDRATYFERIPEFLDIEPIMPDFETRVNKSVTYAQSIEDREKITAHFSEIFKYVIQRFDDVPESWREDFQMLEREMT